MLTVTHFFDVDFLAIEKGFVAICDCGWASDPYEEAWQAEDAGWYHADYPEGE